MRKTTLYQLGSYSREPIYKILEWLRIDENTYLIILASFVGCLAGAGAIVFRFMIHFVQSLSIGGGDSVLRAIEEQPFYVIIIVPFLGGLVVGPLVHFFAREAKGHGVPEVMESVALKGGVIRPRVSIVKSLASAITIGSGGSAGREGPIVLIGSSLGSAVGQWLGVSRERLRILVGCGAAGGIAATFNAPIAGVIFAIEIILGKYAISTLTPLILSSVFATIIARGYFGNSPAFELPPYKLVSAWEVPIYIGLAAILTFVARLFVKSLYAVEDFFAARKDIPEYIKPAIGGFAVGLMLIIVPNVWGNGYETIVNALTEQTPIYWLIIIGFAKILATSLTIGSGGSGGIFAPSLVIGAAFGGAIGIIVHTLFPEITATSGAYAIVGMGVAVAAATQAPLTAFLIIFEMTSEYEVILPLMMSCIIASFLAAKLDRETIYTKKLLRRGIDLQKGFDAAIMYRMTVRDVVQTDVPTVGLKSNFPEILKIVSVGKSPQYYVLDERRRFVGAFDMHDIKDILSETKSSEALTANDFVNREIPTLTPGMSLSEAVRALDFHDYPELPVVDGAGENNFVGALSRRDILAVYNREALLQSSNAVKFVKRDEKGERNDFVEMPPGYEVALLEVTVKMVGKSIRDLDLRNAYGINVIAIKNKFRRNERETPDPFKPLRLSDVLLVAAPSRAIEKFKKEFS
ncbi:MAG: chloride channel protein [Myxococcota bacterium]